MNSTGSTPSRSTDAATSTWGTFKAGDPSAFSDSNQEPRSRASRVVDADWLILGVELAERQLLVILPRDSLALKLIGKFSPLPV